MSTQHDSLLAYIQYLDQIIANASALCVEQYFEELLTADRVNIRMLLRRHDGCLLAINEAVLWQAKSTVHLDYRYHFQTLDNQLIFRYDSTPHFPDLDGFPEHKHLPDGRVISAERPDIGDVLNEVINFVF